MSIDAQPVKDFILEFILTEEEELNLEQPIFSTGIIDSLGIEELVYFIRKSYSVGMEDYCMGDYNINSISDLLKYIEEEQKNQK